ncbi:tyrosine-type recombinase/integrase [Paenibacillus odorifer]|nr:tyrosine-type recombinase/integrase [Paenibacillus odorifer]
MQSRTKKEAAEAELVIRFHDLRHSRATILLENDVSLKAIQERL